jgi:hypothetical protein
MRLPLLVTSLVASCGVLVACSGAGGSTSDEAPGATPPGGSDGGSSGSVDPAAQAPATWSRVTLPGDVKASRVAGDRRGIWLSEVHGAPASIGAGRILADGTYERVYEKQASDVVLSNYTIAAIAPVDTRRAVITGEWFTTVVGQGEESLGTTTSYGTAAFARDRSELWVGSRVTTIRRYGSGSPADIPIVDRTSIHGLWASGSSLYVASGEGVRAIPQPLPSDWNGDASVVARGEYAQMLGLDDKAIAFAVGKAGLVARFDGNEWSTTNAGTKDDLAEVAVASATDAWTASASALFHFDGSAWSSVAGESGMPVKVSSLAALPDGTLWAVAGGDLFRRAPGAVKGVVQTDGGTPTDASVGPCAFGEPNDVYTPFAMSLPASFDACAPKGDSDSFTYVTPNVAAGGYLTVDLEDVDSLGLLAVVNDVTTSPANELWFARSLNGGATTSLRAYVAVGPQRRISLDVSGGSGAGAGRYHASVTFTPFDDAFEPNNKWEDAKAIGAGVAAHAMFPSHTPRPSFNGNDDSDWYLAPHAAGAFTITVGDVAADAKVALDAYFVAAGSSAMGVPLGSAVGASGATTTLSGTLPSAGSIRVEVRDNGSRAKNVTAPPPALVQKYSLTISP